MRLIRVGFFFFCFSLALSACLTDEMQPSFQGSAKKALHSSSAFAFSVSRDTSLVQRTHTPPPKPFCGVVDSARPPQIQGPAQQRQKRTFFNASQKTALLALWRQKIRQRGESMPTKAQLIAFQSRLAAQAQNVSRQQKESTYEKNCASLQENDPEKRKRLCFLLKRQILGE